jgi:carboxymethylenebutenolidase
MPKNLLSLPLALVIAACSVQRVSPDSAQSVVVAEDEHAGHEMSTSAAGGLPAPGIVSMADTNIAPGAAEAAARLQASPRHAEWAMIPTAPGSRDSIAAFVVYPERRDNAPVVVVVHEIFGLSTWVRSVADRMAADGFIAIAPDLLSLERGGATTDSLPYDQARAMISRVTPAKMNAMVAAVAQYGMALPAAAKKYGVVGYCWGGSASFNHAVFNAPGMSASVVYYGSSPSAEDIAKVRVPVLGLYGENDQRVNATIARADSTMKANGALFEQRIYAGARHGFLRAQHDSANAEASRKAWPETVAWFRKYLN